MSFTYDFSNQPTSVSGTTSASYLYGKSGDPAGGDTQVVTPGEYIELERDEFRRNRSLSF
jgi:hypothetical protein